MAVNYSISYKNLSVSLKCPHCGKEIEVPFFKVRLYTFQNGGVCDCPQCGGMIELEDCECCRWRMESEVRRNE